VHQTLSGAPGQAPFEQATLGNSEARSAIIHRTVWFATRRSGHPAYKRLPAQQRSSDTMTVMNSTAAEVRAQKSEVTRLSGVTPDCPVQQDDKTLKQSTAQNPNGRADMARTGQ
jgi:hypothetical protein